MDLCGVKWWLVENGSGGPLWWQSGGWLKMVVGGPLWCQGGGRLKIVGGGPLYLCGVRVVVG